MVRNSFILFATAFFMVTSVWGVVTSNAPNKIRNRCWHGVYVSALSWHSPRKWTVYVNGKKFTPRSLKKGPLSIDYVTESIVHIKVFYRNSWRKLQLQPLQSYNLITRNLEWGDCRVN